MKIKFSLLLTGLLGIFLLAFIFFSNRSSIDLRSKAFGKSVYELIDAQSNGFEYAYAPSIIKTGGKYHVFFCSKGEELTWDYIRYASSVDGKSWSIPVIKLRAQANLNSNKKWRNLAACDPSVVYYKGYYYLFYGNAYNVGVGNENQGYISVARSQNIDGTYLTYSERGTWEDNPIDPKILIKPQVLRINPTEYGVGQPTIVTYQNNLYMWYTDSSLTGNYKIYLRVSNNAADWSNSLVKEINLSGINSVDVKFDPLRQKFIMIGISNQTTGLASLFYSTSLDGLQWSNLKDLIPVGQFVLFAHNPGILGDETGSLLPEQTIVGFGAPYNLAKTNTWGKWNVYGIDVDLTSSSILLPPPSVPTVLPLPVPVYRFVTPKGYHFFTSNPQEINSANTDKNYIKEGIGFYAYIQPAKDLYPVYLLSRAQGDYLYTLNQAEVEYAKKFNYNPEGVVFYASLTGGSSLLPVYRLNNGKEHFFTTSLLEKNNAMKVYGFKDEGIAFYVPNSP